MASLKEYFDKDSDTMKMHRKWELFSREKDKLADVIAQVHFNFDSNAKFISFYVAPVPGKKISGSEVLVHVAEALAIANDVEVSTGFGGQMYSHSKELQFTRRVFVYSEQEFSQQEVETVKKRATENDLYVVLRDNRYAQERDKASKPLAFISHDSRDKESIARPLAQELQRHLITVWYDEYSLRVGDSLREAIENGLRDAAKCILVLTPNFLQNEGWAKREYDSIFTREIVEKRNVFLPIWHEISREDAFKFSPILADRVALNWSEGVESVAGKLATVLRSS